MISTNTALAIVAGGTVLGALAGVAVNPVMKPPPEQPWKERLQKEYVPTPSYRFVEAAPEDLSPPPGWMNGPDPELAAGYGVAPVYEPAFYGDYELEPLPPLPEYEPVPAETYPAPAEEPAPGIEEYVVEIPSAGADRAGRAAAKARETAQEVLQAAGRTDREATAAADL